MDRHFFNEDTQVVSKHTKRYSMSSAPVTSHRRIAIQWRWLSSHCCILIKTKTVLNLLLENWRHISSPGHIYTLTFWGGLSFRFIQPLLVGFCCFNFISWLSSWDFPQVFSSLYGYLLEKIDKFMHGKVLKLNKQYSKVKRSRSGDSQLNPSTWEVEIGESRF